MTAEILPRVERTEDGRALWIHVCSGISQPPHRIDATLPVGENGWRWEPDGSLTPSILCGNCGIHGFWIGGAAPYWRTA